MAQIIRKLFQDTSHALTTIVVGSNIFSAVVVLIIVWFVLKKVM
jgi:hypothetical protein